ncbi:hypothetical protein EDB19DRAFT_1732809 [Suillus lakei]|nr:hypothetical protein EDB19DRAFT_1732809 [Suillus lakei]
MIGRDTALLSLLLRHWCSSFPSPHIIISWAQGIHLNSTISGKEIFLGHRESSRCSLIKPNHASPDLAVGSLVVDSETRCVHVLHIA